MKYSLVGWFLDRFLKINILYLFLLIKCIYMFLKIEKDSRFILKSYSFGFYF